MANLFKSISLASGKKANKARAKRQYKEDGSSEDDSDDSTGSEVSDVELVARDWHAPLFRCRGIADCCICLVCSAFPWCALAYAESRIRPGSGTVGSCIRHFLQTPCWCFCCADFRSEYRNYRHIHGDSNYDWLTMCFCCCLGSSQILRDTLIEQRKLRQEAAASKATAKKVKAKKAQRHRRKASRIDYDRPYDSSDSEDSYSDGPARQRMKARSRGFQQQPIIIQQPYMIPQMMMQPQMGVYQQGQGGPPGHMYQNSGSFPMQQPVGSYMTPQQQQMQQMQHQQQMQQMQHQQQQPSPSQQQPQPSENPNLESTENESDEAEAVPALTALVEKAQLEVNPRLDAEEEEEAKKEEQEKTNEQEDNSDEAEGSDSDEDGDGEDDDDDEEEDDDDDEEEEEEEDSDEESGEEIKPPPQQNYNRGYCARTCGSMTGTSK